MMISSAVTMPYSSSLTDSEWEILEPLLVEILPPKKRTRPSNWTKRDIINGIFYQLKNGAHLGRLTERPAALLNCLLAL
ncbi:transposase [Chlorogloea sp. CCALA 695]|uniref:transposase n=1 Tax=Chlorogloea sp. CCALA 695 TaxID=2107693 RepID=UPI0018EB9D98|nr:transposase [Chlorogloea sp. CCALA 695]